MNVQRLSEIYELIEAAPEEVAQRFYESLFRRAPEVRDLFRSVGMEMQGRMVVQALGIAVHHAERPDEFEEIFGSLGKRHALYGVQPHFYAFIQDAMIETLEGQLGDSLTETDAADWRELLKRVTDCMRRAGSLSPEPASHFKQTEMPGDAYLARFLRKRSVSLPPPTTLPASSARVKLKYLGEKTVECGPMQTILEASRGNDIPHICECGGTARCSTCRVVVLEGQENCLPRSTLERRMAEKKGFSSEIRLACQTRVVGDVTVKRLVRDDNDAAMAVAGSLGEAGQEIHGAVLFTDIWGFTSFSEANLPYDIVHSLNLLFSELGAAIDERQGYVDKYIGDNVMAIFGLGGESAEEICQNAVSAALAMLERLPRVNEYLRNYLDHEFRLGIGIAYGPMVVGELGFALKRQFTAIGDTVNVAARLESETRKQNVDLLVSDSVAAHLRPGAFEIRQSFDVSLKGKSEPMRVHELGKRK